MKERDRVASLQAIAGHQTGSDESLDRITRLAAELFEAPIAAISLVGEHAQKLKSCVGMEPAEQARAAIFDNVVLRSRAALIVADVAQDTRFREPPSNEGDIRLSAYAGVPLLSEQGHAIGTLYIADKKPRAFPAAKMAALKDLADLVMTQFELSRSVGRKDPVTALPNRQQFAHDIRNLARQHRGQWRTLVMIEALEPALASRLAWTVGTHTLETLLNRFAARLQNVLRGELTIYHVTEVRFAILLDGDGIDQHRQYIENLLSELHQRTGDGILAHDISPSAGVVRFQLTADAFPDCLRKAWNAVHQNNVSGRRLSYYDEPADQENQRRYALLADIPHALRNDGFHLAYQPKVNVTTRLCTSVEALLRWQHPVWGAIPPNDFLPYIANTSVIHPLTEWVLTTAFEQLAHWRTLGLSTRLAVNVSSRNLDDDTIVRHIEACSKRYDIDPRLLELECTESEVLTHSKALRILNSIRDLGVRICLDDFGTGYCNFSYLQEIPATALKLDQSLVQLITINSRDRRIVKSIISLAHDLGYLVIAEGVESEDVLNELAQLGCDEAQGYFISRPQTGDAMTQWLLARSTSHVNTVPFAEP